MNSTAQSYEASLNKLLPANTNLMTLKKKFIFIFTVETCGLFLKILFGLHGWGSFESQRTFPIEEGILETSPNAFYFLPVKNSASSSHDCFYRRASGTSTYKNRGFSFNKNNTNEEGKNISKACVQRDSLRGAQRWIGFCYLVLKLYITN